MSYATENELDQAINLGYRASRSKRPGHSFVKGEKHIWSFWSYTAWQTADLIGGQWVNHKPYDTLGEALNR